MLAATFSNWSIEVVPLCVVLDTPLREALPTLLGIERLEDLDGGIGWRFGVVTVWLASPAETA